MGQILCFADVETTGLDHKVNSVHEIAMIVDIDGKFKGRFHARLKPEEEESLWSPEALKKTHVTVEELRALPPPGEAYKDLKEFLSRFVDPLNIRDKMFFVAYNAPFDSDFIRSFFERREDKFFGSWWWFPPICVMQAFAFLSMESRPDIWNFKLTSIAKFLEIPVAGEAHKAMNDVRLCRTIFYKLLGQ